MPKFYVRPLNLLERTLDQLCVPAMYLIQGNCWEHPQQTHRWNNHHYDPANAAFLNESMTVHVAGDTKAKSRQHAADVRFHIPVADGWRRYVVTRPSFSLLRWWYVGWSNEKLFGISRLPLRTPVRLLCGPDDVRFFGLNAKGIQIPIHSIGDGTLGTPSPWSALPLR